MKHTNLVRALQVAKTKLWDGVRVRTRLCGIPIDKYEYICHCLPASRSGDILRTLIHTRLDGSFCVESWLDGIGVPFDQLTSKNVQDFRLRWLDELIKEFS